MKDILPYIYELIHDTARTELSYADIGDAELPIMILSETGNRAEIVCENNEAYSVIGIQIDIYALTEQETRETALRVSDILTEAGLRRTGTRPVEEDGMKRLILEFECGIDRDNRIYCGSDSY